MSANALRRTSNSIGGHARRNGKGTPHLLPREQKLEDLSAEIVFDHVEQQRHVRQFGILLHAKLRNDADLAAADLVRVRPLDGAPGYAATSVRLAAVDCQHHAGIAGIARYDLEFGSQVAIDQSRIEDAVGFPGFGSEHNRALARIIDGFYLAPVGNDQNIGLANSCSRAS